MTYRIWDKESPINGCPAGAAIEALGIRPNDEVYIIVNDDGADWIVQTQSNAPYPGAIVEESAQNHLAELTRPPALDSAKTAKLAELGEACEQSIFAGMDVKTSQGTEHFSLTLNDQTNISVLAGAISQGTPTVPYHADGKLCRKFTALEVTALMSAATAYKTYHTTLCNHLNVWVRRSVSVEEVQAITYTSPLPDDLQSNFDSIIGGAANEQTD